MAEKIKIAELNIDDKALLKSLSDTKKAIDTLKQSQTEMSKAGDTNSETFVQNQARLKSLQGEYGRQIKVLQATTVSQDKHTAALNKEIKSVDDAAANNKELRLVRNQLNATTEEGAKAIAEINKKIDDNTDFIKDNSSALEKQKQNVGNYRSALDGAKIGVKAFGGALKAMGIGLIIAGIAKLTEAFGRNQKIMNAVSTVANAIGIVFDRVVGTIVDTVQAVYQANGGFDALGRVISNVVNLALTPLKLSFFTIKGAIQGAQLIWEKSFFGGKDAGKIKELEADLKATNTTIKEIAVEAVESGKAIVKDFKEAAGEVVGLGVALSNSVSKISLKGVLDDAQALTDYRNSIESLIATQEGLVLQNQRNAEKLRQIRDDESNSLADRKAANEELGRLLDKQAKDELALVGLKVKGAEQELALNKGNVELEAELIRLRNERLEVEERIEGQRSEKLANDNALRKEELDNLKAFEEQKQALQDAIDAGKLEKEQEKEELRLEREYEKQVAELERMTLNEEQKIELQKLLEERRGQELADIQTKYRNIEAAGDEKLQKEKIKSREKTLDSILALTNAETGIGQAALLAKQALALKEWAIDSGLFAAKAGAKVAEASADVAAGTAKTASSVPFPANIPLVLGFIAQSLPLIGTLKKVLGKKPAAPKFATGGVLSGASHANGGIQTPYGELEGGEAVINKRSTALFRPILSKINEAGGGRKFASGGLLGDTPQSGSFINYDLLAAKVAEANMSLPAPRVGVDEISSVANRVAVIEKQGTF